MCTQLHVTASLSAASALPFSYMSLLTQKHMHEALGRPSVFILSHAYERSRPGA